MKKKGLVILVTALALSSVSLVGRENLVLATNINADVLDNLDRNEKGNVGETESKNNIDTQVNNIQPKKY